MKPLSRLSVRRALAIALAWPLILVGLPLAFWLGVQAYDRWLSWRFAANVSLDFRIQVFSWPGPLAILLLPPLVFLGIWRFGRRSRS